MNRRSFTSALISVGLVSTGIAATGCSLVPDPNAQPGTDAAEQVAMTSEITVYRSPTCGCCGLWIEHMEAAGFTVKDNLTEDMTAIKEQYGVPANLASCHTTIVDGYVVEGHIPAEDVQRLLAEKPDVAGIAVPGMPIGSPGMEAGDYVEPYTVFSFTESGETAAFAKHS
ncbi:DUF411 domain-containing protein [Oscillatoria sp. CS-180]|uniref:DUF411 domain-containing protein n=1 Tax=Oscillatoria sp. CS-180 TaxID=3021720 RepID=UPI002330B51B|nr:DUF411 domain-containing protein [Oscillatoria sp. CS-180]MDB9527904.1 DUF411 domain-containing protein [Oscillatoria sp. CS-180]